MKISVSDEMNNTLKHIQEAKKTANSALTRVFISNNLGIGDYDKLPTAAQIEVERIFELITDLDDIISSISDNYTIITNSNQG